MGPQVDKSATNKKQDSTLSDLGVEQDQASLLHGHGVNGHGVNSDALIQRSQQPRRMNARDILYLQRTVGNRAVSNLLGRKANDHVQGHVQGHVQEGVSIGAQGGEVDGETARAILHAKGGGRSVPKQIAADVQRNVGVGVDHARIHTGKHAETLSRKLNAEAFTHGRDVFFGKGAYQPGTASGKQLLAHELTHVAQQAGATTNPVQPQLHNGLVQRRLKFKPDELDGEVSKRGKRAGKLGFESTFSKLQRYLAAYWDAGKDMQLQVTLLVKMDALVKQWMKRYNRKEHIDANQGLKSMSIMKLKSEIDIELPKVKDKISSVDFMKKYTYGSEHSDGMMISGVDDRLKIGKQLKHMEKHNIAMPDDLDDLRFPDGKGGEMGTVVPDTEWGKLHKQYKREKPLGLTPANRAALHAYTGDQYRWMNPAMADNEDWFQSTMTEKMGMGDKRTKDKKWRKNAMNQNKEIGGMLNSTLTKLPNWKQDKMLYRGETIPDAEAQQFQKGMIKTFSIFVSTSQSLDTPKSQLGTFKSPARPWGIIYHITSSKTGKDVAAWSNSPGEEEILFAPNTKFQVTEIISRDDTQKMLEVKVVQV